MVRYQKDGVKCFKTLLTKLGADMKLIFRRREWPIENWLKEVQEIAAVNMRIKNRNCNLYPTGFYSVIKALHKRPFTTRCYIKPECHIVKQPTVIV